jgi:hypothetical protein
VTTASIDHLAALLRYCEEFAKQMLAEAGEFHPFGAFLDPKSQLQALGGHLGTERPKGSDLYSFLQGAVSEMAVQERLIAYALAANVNVPSSLEAPFQEGIRVQVEAPQYSRLVYTPYRILPLKPLRRFLVVLPLVEYAEPIAVDAPPSAFARREV